jgi:NAD(P)-dependent dehydrogenase (short-subunit alcohol dehydrogenase family)
MSQPTMIVTGASRGLGAAIAYMAATSGFQVVLTARSKAALDQQAQKIEQLGGKALAIPGDVSRFEDCKNIIDQTMQTFGRIDALINNAAVIEPFGPISGVSPEEWSRHLGVNLLGPMMMCQLAIPYLRPTRGRMINLTSHAAESALPGASAYSTSKAALNRFSKVLAVEEPDLTVILLIPGEVDTPMQEIIRTKSKGKTDDGIYQYFVDLYQQGRLLPPEQPAKAVVSLALSAPHEWSGEILEWDEARVQALDGVR